MAYLRPAFFARRIFNPLAMRFGINGAVTLVVAGRRSGHEQAIPVTPVEYGGARYLVSPRGEAEWVRNLRASGGEGMLRSAGKSERFHASEIPAAERPPILTAYQKVAGRAVAGNFAALPEPQDHPIFRLAPA